MARRSSDAPADALPRDGLVEPASTDATKPRRRRKARHRDDPPADLVAWKAGAEKRIRKRPTHPMIMLEPAGFDQEHMVPIHNDERLHDLQLAEAFGTRSRSVIYTFMSQLEALCTEKWWDEEAHQWRLNEHTFNTVLTLVSAIKPRNEMEAALAAQMAAVHMLTMKVTARAIQYDHDTRTAAAAGKLARTFAMQTETLQGLRGKRRTTRQSITVTKELHQHVHYHHDRGATKPADNAMEPMEARLLNASRCNAMNRAGKSCRSPAVRGKARCRMHGGTNPGAPKGERNGQWKHGGDTLEAVALRRSVAKLLREIEHA